MSVDKEKVWDDIKTIIDEIKTNNPKRYVFQMDSDKVLSNGVLVPRYYWETKEIEANTLAQKNNCTLIPIQQLIDEGVIKAFDGHGSPPSEYKGMGDVPYIRVKDVVNWELYKDPTALIPEQVYLQKKGKSKELQVGDIAYVRRGSYRIGSVAMVSKFDTKALFTREILLLRVNKLNNKYGIDPYYLLYLLSTEIVQMQAFNKVLIETTLPNIGNRWRELKLPISNIESERVNISKRIKYVMDKKWDAVEEINRLKNDLGNLLT